MTAVALRFRAELRAHWRTWLVLGVLTGVASGSVTAMVAAARRTATALDRYTVAVRYADAYVVRGFAFGDDTLSLDRIARGPQVVASQQSAELAVISRSRSGHSIYPAGPDSVLYRVPTDGRRANAIDRPQVLDGRLPDPDRPDEAIADTNALRSLGVGVGDRLALRMITHDALVSDPAGPHLTADPLTTRVGPLVKIRIVGSDPTSQPAHGQGAVLLTPAFYRAHGGAALGSFTEFVAVRLRHGGDDLPAFRLQVGRVAGRRPYGLFEPADSLPRVQRAIDLQAAALRLLAAFGAAAVLLLVGQAMSRQAALAAREQTIMRALGISRAQLMTLGIVRALTVAVPAAALTAAVAFVLSALAPVGVARDLEPDPGFALDTRVVATGAAVVLACIVGVGAAASWRFTRGGGPGWAAGARSGPGRGVGHAQLGRRLAGWPPSIAAGVRMALVRREGPVTVPVRATLTAAILAVGVAAVAVTFAASLDHLLTTPRLYGQTWDFESGGGPALSPALVRRLMADPALAAIAAGNDSSVEIGGREVAVRAMVPLKGSIQTPVLEGRAPRGPDEMLLGTRTLHALRTHVGAFVPVRSGTRTVRLRVVGRGILPPSGNRNRLGEGAVLSFAALKRIQPDVPRSVVEIRIAPGADRTAALARLTVVFDPSAAVPPAEVGDYGGVQAMPVIVAALFAAVALAALGHSLVTSVRRRRRDLAVLKTLGFTRNQVLVAVACQATTVAAVGVAVGLPAGIAFGRFGWHLFAQTLGVVPEPVTPLAPMLLLIPITVVVADFAAAVPGRLAGKLRPALVLRAE